MRPRYLLIISLLIFGLGIGISGWALFGNVTGLLVAVLGYASFSLVVLFWIETEYYFWKLGYLAGAIVLVAIDIGVYLGSIISIPH